MLLSFHLHLRVAQPQELYISIPQHSIGSKGSKKKKKRTTESNLALRFVLYSGIVLPLILYRFLIPIIYTAKSKKKKIKVFFFCLSTTPDKASVFFFLLIIIFVLFSLFPFLFFFPQSDHFYNPIRIAGEKSTSLVQFLLSSWLHREGEKDRFGSLFVIIMFYMLVFALWMESN